MKRRCFFYSVALGTALFVCAACAKNAAPQQEGAEIASFSSVSAAPGRVRADLAAYRIAYYEPVAAEADDSGGVLLQESDEPFTITAFGPQEELPSEIKKPSIYAVFSQPVVPLAKLGDPITEEAGLFAIDPPLKGVYRWYGTKLLSFEPDGDVLPQQAYGVTVSDKIQSLGGKKLEGATSFSFETERLGVLSWSLGPAGVWTSSYNAPPEDARFITAVFSHAVDLDEIARWIEVRGAGKTFPFTLSRPEKIERGYYTRNASDDQFALITMNDRPPVDTAMNVTLKAGARSRPGWLGSKEPASYSFHTLRPFKFEDASARAYSSPRVRQYNSIPITVSFNYGVEEKGAERFFSIEGLPALTPENVSVYGSSVILSDLPLRYETDYTLAIAGGLRDVLGRTLGRDENVVVSVGGANSYVSIYDRGPKMLEAAYPARYVWETQNPISISAIIGRVNSPYERVDASGAAPLDVSIIPPNQKHFIMEDLSPYLGASGKGTVGMYWRYQTKSSWRPGRVDSGAEWLSVQVTDIGITVRYAYNAALVWATRLSTGEPVANALVQLLNSGTVAVEGRTDSQGLAAFDFPDGAFVSMFSQPSYSTDMQGAAGGGFGVKVIENGGAAAGGDEAEFIPNGSHNLWRFDVEAAVDPFNAERERPVVFLFTDRGLYKPGETVTFRGVDRTLSRGKYQPYVGPYTVEVSTGMYNAKPIASLRGETTRSGGSYGSFTLPADLDPGVYTIKYSRANATQALTFTTANFEALRFEASLASFDSLRYKGDALSMHFSANYLAGGALSGAPYTYFWTRDRAWFAPPAPWEHWSFGPDNTDGGSFVGRGEGSLGPDGSADIAHVAADDGVEGAPYSYRLEASVQDASRQQISSRASVMVHPARFYIGARLDEGVLKSADDIDGSRRSAWFLAAGKPATASWALVAPQGTASAAPYAAPESAAIKAQFIRYDWKQSRQAGIGGRVNVSWERVEEVVEEKTFSPGKNTAGVLPFTPAKSGQWEIRLASKDEKGRPVVTRMGFYVSGGGWVHWGSDDIDAITLTPDKPEYAVGETAKLLVRSPLPKGNYLLTIEREGVISEKIIELDGSARMIDIPIDESYVPIVYVALSSHTVRSGPPRNTYYDPDLDKPKGIFGVAGIRVDAETRHYKVEIEPQKPAYRPKDQAEVKVTVTLGGKPVAGAELTFMAVDRGVVDLIDYHVPDPLAYFYAPRNFPLGVRGADSRSLLIDPVVYALTDLQGGDSEDGSKMEERKDFRPTAVFEPYLATGADGTVTVKFPLPDSLTTYRCTAVAVGVENFGVNERDLRVSQPLNAVIATPRTLRWRDTGTVSLILTNLEAAETTATVTLATENVEAGGLWGDILAVDGETEKTVSIAPGATTEARFMVAAVGAGEARLTFTLASPSVNERITRTIAVNRPVVYETVSAIGNLNDERPFIEEGVVLPAIAPEGTGSLGVTLAASRLAQLKDAVQYLLTYPYGCLEQRTAALLPLVAFGDHLGAFQLESPVKNPKAVVEAELAAIAKCKLPDGLYPYWPGGGNGNPMVSLRVAHIALLAKQKGYAVPGAIDAGAIIKSLRSYMAANTLFEADPFLAGYRLWIRAMNGEKLDNDISDYLNRGDELGVSGYGFAGLAAFEAGDKKTAADIASKIKNFLRPGTRSVDLTDTYESKGNFWGHDVDRYAIALMLCYSLYPNDDMTTRLATSIIERQRRGVWTNTASSFWAVLAFGRIADAEADLGANMRGIVTLDSKPFAQVDFAAYGGTLVAALKLFTDPPVSDVRRDTSLPLRIERQGSGALYYGVSLRYGIPAELAAMRDEGVGVFAETLDDNGAVVKDGRLIAGKTYTRRVTVSSSRDRTFLALRAPAPSGAEIVDAAFVTSSTTPPKTNGAERSWWDWVEPPLRFIMDDEIRFHWDFFKAGRQTVEFRFRAVMPGVYPTPPAQAECMYEEEIFGRSAGELVRIEDAPPGAAP